MCSSANDQRGNSIRQPPRPAPAPARKRAETYAHYWGGGKKRRTAGYEGLLEALRNLKPEGLTYSEPE